MRAAVSILIIIMILLTLVLPVMGLAESGTAVSAPNLFSEAAILLDADSGQILFDKNMHQVMYPASITKVVTAMLALRLADPADVVTMSYDAVFSVGRDTSHIALDTGEQITLEQALYALAIASANDASNGVAELVGGSIEGFVGLMNQAARDAGALATNFTNAHGLPDNNHYTTAYDMAVLTAEALKVPGFIEIFGSRFYEIPPTNRQPLPRLMSTRNDLLNGETPCEGVLISKTGWTRLAEGTQTTAARRNGVTLIAVVLKSAQPEEKYLDTLALFDYGFNQFSQVTLPRDTLTRTAVALPSEAGEARSADFAAGQDISFLLPADKSRDDIAIIFGTPEVSAAGNEASMIARIMIKGADPEDETQILASVPLTARLAVIETTAATNEPAVSGELSETRNSGPWLLFLPIIVLLLSFSLLIRELSGKRKRRRRRSRLL